MLWRSWHKFLINNIWNLVSTRDELMSNVNRILEVLMNGLKTRVSILAMASTHKFKGYSTQTASNRGIQLSGYRWTISRATSANILKNRIYKLLRIADILTITCSESNEWYFKQKWSGPLMACFWHSSANPNHVCKYTLPKKLTEAHLLHKQKWIISWLENESSEPRRGTFQPLQLVNRKSVRKCLFISKVKMARYY